jgi:hypothetical protein
VNVVLLAIAAMDRPFQADRLHRAGTDLAVAVGIGVIGHQRLFFDDGMFIGCMDVLDGRLIAEHDILGLADDLRVADDEDGLGVLQDAGDGRQRVVGRVDL